MNVLFFFFNASATPEIYTLSLHDALPISQAARHAAELSSRVAGPIRFVQTVCGRRRLQECRVALYRLSARCFQREDRKSTRLNSSHMSISYAVFCLKKKKK